MSSPNSDQKLGETVASKTWKKKKNDKIKENSERTDNDKSVNNMEEDEMAEKVIKWITIKNQQHQ